MRKNTELENIMIEIVTVKFQSYHFGNIAYYVNRLMFDKSINKCYDIY